MKIRLCAMLAICGCLALAQQGGGGPQPIKATFQNVLKLNAYADNWCMIYINGKLAAMDQIEFLPHNVVQVSVLPIYPMTIAVLARDNADPKTGMEYGTQIGDAGFILKLSNGVVSDAKWKVKTFFKGPLDRDTRNPRVQYTPIPANWFAPDFDDSSWANATEYPASRVGPDGDYASYDFAGAKFIWSDDIDLDNTVIFRYTVPKPAGYNKTWNADGDFEISNIVNEARLAPATGLQLYRVNDEGLAAGYITRTRDGVDTVEDFSGQAIDLGPAGDSVRLTVYGATTASDGVTATVGGVDVDAVTVEAMPATSGMAMFHLVLPRTLAGAGLVDLTIRSNGKVSNPVMVRIQ